MQGFGSSRAGVWLIKRVVTPLDRWLYPLTGGRVLSTGLRRGRVLLLMTTGRRTGKLHTTPVFYIADAERLVLCSVTPPLERASPWTLNLRAQPLARVQVGGTVGTYFARDATSEEVDRYWPRLIGMWPTYEEHYARSRRRVLFVLEPTPNARRVHPGYHSVTPHIAVSDPAETCRVPPDGAPGVSVRLRG